MKAAGFAIPPQRCFVAVGVSGRAPGLSRPAFSRLVDRLEPEDTLVVSKLDRVGRDSVDLEQTLRHLEDKGVCVVVLQPGKMDLTSTAGRLIRKVLGAVAQMERDMLVERTKAGMERARSQGKTIGRPPKTTELQRVEMRLRAAAGASISSLARTYGVGRASVLTVVRQAV